MLLHCKISPASSNARWIFVRLQNVCNTCPYYMFHDSSNASHPRLIWWTKNLWSLNNPGHEKDNCSCTHMLSIWTTASIKTWWRKLYFVTLLKYFLQITQLSCMNINPICLMRSQDNILGTVTRLWSGQLRKHNSMLSWNNIFFLPPRCWEWLCRQHSILLDGYHRLFTRG